VSVQSHSGAPRRARIHWSAAQVRHGLPYVTRTVDPAWFVGDPSNADGWSLMCRFEQPPSVQGNPSMATVCFVVAHAPHDRLRPGTELHLFERATGQRAALTILP
jgi:hypothetical protein